MEYFRYMRPVVPQVVEPFRPSGCLGMPDFRETPMGRKEHSLDGIRGSIEPDDLIDASRRHLQRTATDIINS